MKKITLFLVLFLFSGILTAREMQNGQDAAGNNEPAAATGEIQEGGEAAAPEAPAAENHGDETEPSPQKEETPPETTEKSAEPAPAEIKTESAGPEEKPDKFFFLPTIGAGSGYGIFNVNAGFWINLLVNRSKSGNNTYLGIKTHVGYTPLDFSYKLIIFPIELNALIDFKVENDVLAYLGWWFSAGIGLSWEIYGNNENEIFKNMAWGTGLSLLFKNRVTFIAGINGNPQRYFDVNFAVGYRF